MYKTFTCEYWEADTEERVVERNVSGKLQVNQYKNY